MRRKIVLEKNERKIINHLTKVCEIDLEKFSHAPSPLFSSLILFRSGCMIMYLWCGRS